MQRRLLCLIIVLTCCVPPLSRTLPRHKATTFRWTFRWRPGQMQHYRQWYALSGHQRSWATLEVACASRVKCAVVGVDANGNTTFKETVEARNLIVNGHPVQKTSGSPVVTHILTSRGLLVGYSLQNAAPNDNPAECHAIVDLIAMLTQTPTPPKPVRLGETWKIEIKNRWVPGQKIAYVSTLVGPAKVAGKNTLHVKFAVTIPLVDHPGPVDSMDAVGDYDVEPISGVLMRGRYTVDNVQFHWSSDTAKVVTSERFELLEPGSKNQDILLPDKAAGKSEESQKSGNQTNVRMSRLF